jgi:hypothetical protein
VNEASQKILVRRAFIIDALHQILLLGQQIMKNGWTREMRNKWIEGRTVLELTS